MTHAQNNDPTAPHSIVNEWDKVFPQDNSVKHTKVSFKNRFGISLVADLYSPHTTADQRLPAIALSGPFGAVKEQSSGLYAQILAQQGFITLAFDPSFTGESGGYPRNVASPDINTEDFSAAIDFLAIQPNVNAQALGIVGICGWGGMALNAAAIDTRIKATLSATMYDMTRVMAYGYNDSVTVEQRAEMRDKLNQQRSQDALNGEPLPSSERLPEKLNGDEPEFVKNYFDYYKTPRGFHPRSINSNQAWTTTTPLSFINAKLLAFAGEIKNPVLIIHGEKAHSRYFSEDAFKQLKGENKTLTIIPDANHVDLYDNQEKIPFTQIVNFFSSHLK